METPKESRPAGSSRTPCSRVLRAWIEDREDGSLVAYRDYKDAFEAGDGRAVPYLKMTPEIIAALTKAKIIKIP